MSSSTQMTVAISKAEKYDRFYMDLAIRTAEMSYAVRKKVGCVIVKDNQIISYGWNGMPAGMDNVCETVLGAGSYNLVTKEEVSHAEENAIGKIAKSTMSSSGSTAYVTLEPCIHCAKLLASSGIVRVVVSEKYRINNGVVLLQKLGIIVDYV